MPFFRTITEYVALFLRRKKRLMIGNDIKHVVYTDNRFERHFDQVAPFFDTGFIPAADAVLLCKFHIKSFAYTRAAARARGIKVMFFVSNAQIPDLGGKHVFYPYNAQSNCRLILDRNATHIFLTHGESNKKASVNRMARLYDHVLACGDIAVDRYVQYGIFSRDDITRNKVIRMGDTVISGIDSRLFAQSTANSAGCLFYMPTWEGGFEAENFSSVTHPQTAQVLGFLCRQLQVNNILIKPHPNLGARQVQAAVDLKNLINALQAQNINIAYTDVGNHSALSRALTSCAGAHPYEHGTFHPVRGVVDVSAAEAMLAIQHIPSFVLAKQGKDIFAPDLYWQLRHQAVIRLGENTWKNTLAAYIGSDLEIQDQKKFLTALLSYTMPALATMSPAERMNWLVKTTCPVRN